MMDKLCIRSDVYAVMPEGEKIGGPVVIGGDIMPSPGWNRVN